MVDDYRAILSHLRRANLKIFSNHGGWLQGHSQPFEKGRSQNFLQPWWMIIWPFSAISEGKILKFPPTTVGDYRAILSHFRRVNLNIFFSHGGLLQGHSQPSLNVKSQNFLQPWWIIIGHSQPFQKGKSQNFLQPWWKIIGTFSAISEG